VVSAQAMAPTILCSIITLPTWLALGRWLAGL
jgi:hypothetical protein